MSVDKNSKLVLTNKKAFFNYEMIDDLEVGIALEGTEVKSIREGKVSFADSYVKIENGELKLVGFSIQPYKQGSVFNHIPDRNRKLLAHKQEIKRFKRKVEEKGLTIVPTKIYFKDNLVKMNIALARGKNVHDKKEAIKEHDLKIQAGRDAREYKFK